MKLRVERWFRKILLWFSRLPAVHEVVKQLPALERAAEWELEQEKDDAVYKRYREYLES